MSHSVALLNAALSAALRCAFMRVKNKSSHSWILQQISSRYSMNCLIQFSPTCCTYFSCSSLPGMRDITMLPIAADKCLCVFLVFVSPTSCSFRIASISAYMTKGMSTVFSKSLNLICGGLGTVSCAHQTAHHTPNVDCNSLDCRNF